MIIVLGAGEEKKLAARPTLSAAQKWMLSARRPHK